MSARRYLNPAWKNRSTEELEAAWRDAWAAYKGSPVGSVLADTLLHLRQELVREIDFRKREAS